MKNSYHIKRYFFNKDLCSHYLMHDNLNLVAQWQKDNDLVGIDNILLFDHGYNKVNKVRCGNINPTIAVENSLPTLNSQIQLLKDKNVFTLCYFDPYIIEHNSEMENIISIDCSITDKSGHLIRVWGYKNWHPCLGIKKWKNYSKKYVKQLLSKLDVDGIYLDEIGNGTQYQCQNPKHNHNEDQIDREKKYTENILSVCSNTIAMCEFPIVDNAAHLYQGVLNDTKSVLDIYRFCIPDVKVYRMINCDYPIGNQYYEVNKAFFNGEGIWLDNDLNDEKWYSKEILKRLKLQYNVLIRYSYCFNSNENVPLIYNNDSILVNRFGKTDSCIYTIINVTDEVVNLSLKYEQYGKMEIVYSYCDNIIYKNEEEINISVLSHEVIAILNQNNKI